MSNETSRRGDYNWDSIHDANLILKLLARPRVDLCIVTGWARSVCKLKLNALEKLSSERAKLARE